MKIFTTKFRNKILVVLFWLLLWHLAAIVVANDIVMVPPYKVLIQLATLFRDVLFYKTVLFSTLRIGTGFIVGLILGIAFAGIACRFNLIDELLAPIISIIKSIPVASFVVLLLIWAGNKWLSFFISFLIVFPNVYVNAISGIKSTEEKKLLLAEDYSYPGYIKAIYITRHSMLPYVISNLKVTVGLAWKSGVAAELIGMSDFSIGSRIYTSKIYLDTASLFAWTVCTVLLSYIFEKLVIKLLHVVEDYKIPFETLIKHSKKYVVNRKIPCEDVDIKNISVSYGERTVLDNISVHLSAGNVYALMGPSGIGKTTLLNEIKKRSSILTKLVYQEDILLDEYDAVTNIFLGKDIRSTDKIFELINKILPTDSINEPVCNYSGGMRRRVSVIRALSHEAGLIIMDEPFTGLDDRTKKELIEVIKAEKNDRTLIFVTHDISDAKALDAQIIRL